MTGLASNGPGRDGGLVDVALTPADARPCDVAVVIDVLRATSTAAQALAVGYRRVLCTDSIERAVTLRARGRILAGEQHSRKPQGFDLGNSPRVLRRRRGKELVLATTNGTPAIVAAASQASTVMLGSMLNLQAIIEAVGDDDDALHGSVQLVCAGTEGGVALEDVYVAGRLSAALGGRRTDAARIAEATAYAYPTPFQGLRSSAHASVLRNAGFAGDVAYCALESTLGVVPVVATVQTGIALVVAAEPGAGGARRAWPRLTGRGTVTAIEEEKRDDPTGLGARPDRPAHELERRSSVRSSLA